MTYRRVRSFQAKANAHRTRSAKFADWITSRFGSTWFFATNAALFLLWIVLNSGLIPGFVVVDAYPFNFLTMVVSLEAIFLSIIVLISQNRAAHIADMREEIDLQLDVITEEELTKVMQLVAYLAEKQGYNITSDKTLKQMLQQLDVNKISELLEKQLN